MRTSISRSWNALSCLLSDSHAGSPSGLADGSASSGSHPIAFCRATVAFWYASHPPEKAPLYLSAHRALTW